MSSSRRRREHDPRTVRGPEEPRWWDGEPDGLGHDPRVAVPQSAAQGAVRKRLDGRDGRELARANPGDLPRGPRPVRAGEPSTGRRCDRVGDVRVRDRGGAGPAESGRASPRLAGRTAEAGHVARGPPGTTTRFPGRGEPDRWEFQ